MACVLLLGVAACAILPNDQLNETVGALVGFEFSLLVVVVEDLASSHLTSRATTSS